MAGVSFEGTGTLDVLSGPAAGDLTGDLTGSLVIVPPDGPVEPPMPGDPVPPPPAPIVTTSGYLVLSAAGGYTVGTDPLAPGATQMVLRPGRLYSTPGVIIDGASRDALEGGAATRRVFGTSATLTGINTYRGGTFIEGGKFVASTVTLPVGQSVSIGAGT